MLALLLPLYGIDTSFSGIALLKNLTLTQAPWSVSATWNYPAWSISAEWHAYLLFPFVVAMLLRGSVPSIARMMFYGIVSLSVVAWTYDGLISVATGPLVLLRVLPEFFAGIVLFRLYTNRHGEWLGRDSSSIGLAALIVASTLVPHTDLLIIVALLPALVLSVAYNSGRVSSLLCWAPFRFLGHISYSVYMVQMIPALLIAFHRPLLAAIGLASVPGEAIVYIGLSVAFGTAISLLIEHPGRRWLRPLLPVGRGDALLSSRAVPSAEN
jgi:peptidoglycan/LPS O-acetylase OafA/YrhL